MFDRPASEIVGNTSDLLTHPDDAGITKQAFVELNASGAPVSVQKRYLRPDGGVVWADTRGTAVHDAQGRPIHIIAHFQDVTAHKAAEALWFEVLQGFETAFADAPIGMALVGLDERLIKVNHALCRLTGYAEAELLALTAQDLTHPDDRAAELSQLAILLSGKLDRYTMEQRYLTAGGEEIWVNLSCSLVRDHAGQPIHLIAQAEDITQRKLQQASLQRMADHDPLTELQNRRPFEDELRHQVTRCRRYGEHAALLMIDLDGFKEINDTYGHACGDRLLRAVAGTLVDRLRTSDTIARLGGDEFAVILANVSGVEAERIVASLRERITAAHIVVDDVRVGVPASIGVALLDVHTTSATDALHHADMTMYKAKLTIASAD